MSQLGVFRVVETVTLKIVNLLWIRDLCATPCVVPANDPINDPINGPINGPVNLTELQELIMQMFAEDKSLSMGRLCEKNGTSWNNSYMRDVAGRSHALFLAVLNINEL